MKKFNTTGVCVPKKHYMVDISKKLDQIISMIEEENYFSINRARQYGKTTTLFCLENVLKSKYQVISISFEGVSEAPFSKNKSFVKMLIDRMARMMRFTSIRKEDVDKWKEDIPFDEEDAFIHLSNQITQLCEQYQVILMVDEIDKCSDNQVFLNFLGLLREKYLLRSMGKDVTFQSVILAGVYDVRNLKLKMRSESEKRHNSPWNVAIEFNVEMGFDQEEIASMLRVYEEDAHTGMRIEDICETIYHYTNGYPYLVSWICKWIDEVGEKNWTKEGVRRASKALLKQRTPLFDDLIKNIEQYKGLREKMEKVLTSGEDIPFTLYDNDLEIASMFGIIRDDRGKVSISNVIFESCLYDYFSGNLVTQNRIGEIEKGHFIKNDGHLDMPYILNRFQALMKAEYRKEDKEFVEQQGRLLFLCFLKPIINGTGFYYVEPETRSSTRMDLVVNYLEEEFIIELKIWHGEQYRKAGIKQLVGYLDTREQKSGYLVSFSFLKNKKYTNGYVRDMKNEDVPGIEDKEIYEVVV